MGKVKVPPGRLDRAVTQMRPVAAEVTDRSPWDWYAESCSCGQSLGACRVHPRARTNQRPPASDWRVWAYVAGRGAGKTRAGACWIQHRVETGIMRLGCLIAPTAADIRDVMVEGQSSLIAIKELADRLPCRGKIDCVRLDPAAGARSSLGPAAYSEYEQVFGPRLVARWPRHRVLHGLETLDLLLESGDLLIHPRCTRLKDAFQTYSHQRRGGEWTDFPADGHPEEDLIDALRGGLRDAFPDGLAPQLNLRRVHASSILG
jgi:hypothetical protein